MNKFIDLGLPSGTKWSKFNYGANSETEYGDYYTWDKAVELSITLPTKEQIEELCDYTTNMYIKNYKGSGVNGRLFVSKINGNAIFFPANGYFSGSNIYFNGSYGFYWSISLHSTNPNFAYSLDFYSEYVDFEPQNLSQIDYGFSVRGVSK